MSMKERQKGNTRILTENQITTLLEESFDDFSPSESEYSEENCDSSASESDGNEITLVY